MLEKATSFIFSVSFKLDEMFQKGLQSSNFPSKSSNYLAQRDVVANIYYSQPQQKHHLCKLEASNFARIQVYSFICA